MTWKQVMTTWARSTNGLGARKSTKAEAARRGKHRSKRGYVPAAETNDGSALQALFSALPERKPK